jgi:enolase-phosphatase E1
MTTQNQSANLMTITTILTDIEGTTSSIFFVKDVLFPYAAKHIPDYVRTHQGDAAVGEVLQQTASESGININDVEALIAQLLQWIRDDKKITPLKTLQGIVWEAGYRNGDYKAHIYSDAAEKLHEWKNAGLDLYVYSSGSVYAQKLFFGFSEAGDINHLFSGNFDTTIGGKKDAASYHAIAKAIGKAIGKAANEILFLSDIREELDAALDAGMQTAWLIRPADSNAVPEASCPHQIAHTFNDVRI